MESRRYYCLRVFGRRVGPWREDLADVRLDAVLTGNAAEEPDGRIVILSPAEIASAELNADGSIPPPPRNAAQEPLGSLPKAIRAKLAAALPEALHGLPRVKNA